jgi:hypothetical protein
MCVYGGIIMGQPEATHSTILRYEKGEEDQGGIVKQNMFRCI